MEGLLPLGPKLNKDIFPVLATEAHVGRLGGGEGKGNPILVYVAVVTLSVYAVQEEDKREE